MNVINFVEIFKDCVVTHTNKIYIYFIIVIVLCSLDVLSGVFNAFMTHNLQSKEFKKGAVGKTAILCIVCLAIILDYIFNLDYLYVSTCIFYILEETLSIIENLQNYIKIPKIITERINNLKIMEVKKYEYKPKNNG